MATLGATLPIAQTVSMLMFAAAIASVTRANCPGSSGSSMLTSIMLFSLICGPPRRYLTPNAPTMAP